MLNRISSPASQNLVSRPWLNNLHPKSICFVRQRFCLWRPIKLDAMDTKRLLWARWRHQIEQERVHVSFTKTRCQDGLLYWWAAGCWLEGQVSPSNGHQGCSGRQLVGTTMTPHQTTPLGFNHICPHSLSNATQLVTPSPMQSYYHHYIQSQEYRRVLTFWRALGPLRITKLPAATTWYLRRPIFWFKLLSSHLCWWIGLYLSIISR